MSEGRSRESHWKVRLYKRVRERGYDSLTAFAEARPTTSLVALAEELGEADISAVQVFSGLVAEAERSHQVTRLVRGQLVRELSESLPEGWPAVMDDANRFEVAQALAFWFGFTPRDSSGASRAGHGSAPRHATAARLAATRTRRRTAAHALARRGRLSFTSPPCLLDVQKTQVSAYIASSSPRLCLAHDVYT